MAVVNVLVENSEYAPATVADAARWQRQYGLPFPVLADTERAWASVWGNPASERYAQHSYTLVDAEGVVLWRETENATFDNARLALILEQLEAL